MSEQIESTKDLIRCELNSFRDSAGDIGEYELGEGWECVDDGEWEQNHKSQYNETIVKHTASGRHFRLARCRSGSYHSNWYYSETDITEVHKVTKTVTVEVWEAVTND